VVAATGRNPHYLRLDAPGVGRFIHHPGGTMTRRPTSRISTKWVACLAALTLLAFGCTTTSEEENTATDSEFVQGDQDEVEEVVVEEVDEVVVSDTPLDLQTVYFDFDRSSIRADARPVLRSNGDQMRRAGAAVRIEGHTDERGDEEYNLALGERRASAVKRYLENLGVDTSKMRTLSYGEAKPAVAGHTEEAWRYNRRVESHARR
jgi:peptidoglycan-associated lipoprotein